MRLKEGSSKSARRATSNMPRDEQQQCLLKNQSVNRQYEENLSTFWSRTSPNSRPTALSNTTRVQRGWTGQSLFHSQQTKEKTNSNNGTLSKSITNSNNGILSKSANNSNPKTPGRDSALASPLDDEDSGERAMSLSLSSSPEEDESYLNHKNANGTSEEDSLSDLEYNESSPLLAPDFSGEEGGSSEEESNALTPAEKRRALSTSTGNHRNFYHRHRSEEGAEEECEDEEEEELESEDSVFSDDSSCDMSDCKDNNYAIENLPFNNNNYNNNINRPLAVTNNKITTVLTNHTANRNLFRGTSRVDKVFTETVQPLLQTVTSRPPGPAARVALKTDVTEAARVLALNMTRLGGITPNLNDHEPPPSRNKLKLTLDVRKSGDKANGGGRVSSVDHDDGIGDSSLSYDRSRSSSSSSDVDINLASDTAMNNVSTAGGKELQCFLLEEEDASVNIVANEDKEEEEYDPKILNTEEGGLSLRDELIMATEDTRVSDSFEKTFLSGYDDVGADSENDSQSGLEDEEKKVTAATLDEVRNNNLNLERAAASLAENQSEEVSPRAEPVAKLSVEKEEAAALPTQPETVEINEGLPERVEAAKEPELRESDLPDESKISEEVRERSLSPKVNEGMKSTPQKQAVVKPYRFEDEEEKTLRVKPVEEAKRKITTEDVATETANVINNNNPYSQQDRKDISVQISANKETSDVALSPVAALNPQFPSLDQTHQPRLNTSSSRKQRCAKNKRNASSGGRVNGDFDVYNIETAMPNIDWEAMEQNLKRAAKENDWLRRNDREEIRRKLAMDSDSEEYYCGERVTRKPSLTTRLQSGMNLQICFMNETASDLDSQGSDQDSENGNPILNHGSPPLAEKRMSDFLEHQPYHNKKILFSDYKRPNGKTVPKYPPKPHSIPEQTSSSNKSVPASSNKQQETSSNRQRPSFFFSRQKSWRLGQLRSSQKKEESTTESMIEKQCSPEEDFLTRHARLQAEARHALSQAKEMARMQMEVERQRKKKSPIADIVGISFPDGRHRLSRQILTDMNVAQLQVIVNDLHSQIESLNEDLVRLLLERDDLNMEQDSMLVDIEDMTRFLGAKEEALKSHIVTASKVAGRK